MNETRTVRLVTTTGDLARYFEDKSIAAPVEAMAQTGFRHLDMSFYRVIYKDSPWIRPGDAWKREVEDAIERAEKTGVDFVQAHSPDGVHFQPGEERDALILATKRSIEACRMLNVPHTVIHAAGCGPDRERFKKENIAFYRLFEETAETFGVDMLTENSAAQWNPEYFLFSGQDMRDFVREAGIARLHLNWDTGHGNVAGRDQYGDILSMGEELRALHVQDNFGTADSHMMPMTGTVNFDRVLQGLRAISWQGDFTFEADNALRRSGVWPHYRRDPQPTDRLINPPLALHQKQLSLMREIGAWMLESYGYKWE